MSNVVDFLEVSGQDARLRHASRDEMKLALANVQMGFDLQVVILAKDHLELQALLGGRVIPAAWFFRARSVAYNSLAWTVKKVFIANDVPEIRCLIHGQLR